MDDKMVTALAGVLVALPGTAALVPNLNPTPEVSFVLLVLSLIGAAILKIQPGTSLSDDDVERIAQAREHIRRAEIAKVKAAGAERG